jgi:uroporphyrinogen-III synthase
VTNQHHAWRIAVTRDEDSDGPLSRALRDAGFEPVSCPVAEETPPADPAPLTNAAQHLEDYEWIVVASQRAVRAITLARGGPWPRGVRTAAVGERTAAALVAAGADPPPLVAADGGADALWAALVSRARWQGTRVLIPAVEGGRRTIIDGLSRAGAQVTVVEPYRMTPRAANTVARDWRAQHPDAVVIASPSAASLLLAAIGHDALRTLRAVAAIGATTAAALLDRGVTATTAPEPSFAAIAAHLAQLRSLTNKEVTRHDG